MDDEWAPIFKEDLLFSDVQFPYATTSNMSEDFQGDLGSNGISPCSSVSSPMDHAPTELMLSSALEGFDGPFLPLFDTASMGSCTHSPNSDVFPVLATSSYLCEDVPPPLISPVKREPLHENGPESQHHNYQQNPTEYAFVDTSPFVFKPIKMNEDQERVFLPTSSSINGMGTPNKSLSTINMQSMNSRKALSSIGRTRSKMHDLAVKSRLITDQNPRSSGSLFLSAEEKRTLVAEGYKLPTKLPLSREEEEALKIVRRKIKNKLSAQESRRKRKEYMDQLEQKVQAYFSDNISLKIRVKQLETTNRELMARVRKLESALEASQSQPLPSLTVEASP